MLNPENIPPVESDEKLARYATQSGHFRSGDKTAKQDLFIPHPYRELSVTRHREANEDEIWRSGVAVAKAQGKTLYGRFDIKVSDCTQGDLIVKADPIINKEGSPDNPNHANIQNWPLDKPAQKSIAQELAARAGKLLPPPSFTPPAASPDSP
jgi:hypothetical protein